MAIGAFLAAATQGGGAGDGAGVDTTNITTGPVTSGSTSGWTLNIAPPVRRGQSVAGGLDVANGGILLAVTALTVAVWALNRKGKK